MLILSILLAVSSGYYMHKNDENRQIYLTVCVVASVAALISGLQLVPEWVWVEYTAYAYGLLCVVFFWMIRTQVKRLLLKKTTIHKVMLTVPLSVMGLLSSSLGLIH